MNIFSEKEKLKLLSGIVEINSVNDNEIEVATYLKRIILTQKLMLLKVNVLT